LAFVKAWSVADMEVEAHHPLVLDSSEEGRLIVIELPAGEEMQEHRVHERAWLVVARGAIEIDDADGETVGGGPGLVAEFNPNESRTVRATEDARILLLLSPWPGEGHPSRT
jgi:quercetin dioxygenase-like cupin family protein